MGEWQLHDQLAWGPLFQALTRGRASAVGRSGAVALPWYLASSAPTPWVACSSLSRLNPPQTLEAYAEEIEEVGRW